MDLELIEADLRSRLIPRDNNLVLEEMEIPRARAMTNDEPIGSDLSSPLADEGPVRDKGPLFDAGPIPDTGAVRFAAVDGPFSRYERLVTWRRIDARRIHAQEFIRFWPAIPVFAPLYHPLMKRALLRDPELHKHPWWSLPDRLNPRQSSVLAVMALFHVIGGMLAAVLTNTLTFAAQDLGTGSASEQSAVLIAARLGAVLTIAVMAMSDRIGRRRVALWSASAAAVLTVLSALSPSLVVLAAIQTLSRNLAIVAMLSSDTISVEEIPAGSRAAAQGLGALSYGLGAGMIIILLPLADTGPGGWRWVFASAALAIPLIALSARWLPESHRFEATANAIDHGARRQKVRLNRLLLLGTLFFAVNFFVAPSSQLQNDYLHSDRGFDGARISIFIVVTAIPGLFGILLGGRWADRRGRRGVLAVGLLSMGVFGGAFYMLSGAAMWLSATAWATLGALSVPALGVLAPELFPTARRGTARGVLAAVATVGSVLGLLVAGNLADRVGYGLTFALIALAPILAMLVSFFLPETAGAELEDLNVSDEDRASP